MPTANIEYDDMSYDQETYSETDNYLPRRKRLYFPTKLRSRIVNAKTGLSYPYYQGSYEELQLFKIIDSTARCDEHGFLQTRSDPVNRDPNFLYYDNPEQFMRHRQILLPKERISKWYANHSKMFPHNKGFIKSEWDRIKTE